MVAHNDQPDSSAQLDGDDSMNSGLSAAQERAIIALLNEPTIQKAAEQAGVSERTLHRWLEDPAFAKVHRKTRREAFSHAIALTNRYAPHAVNTLVKVMSDTAASHNARVSACTALLKFGREGIELDDLVGRIEALEQAAAKSEQTQGKSRWNR